MYMAESRKSHEKATENRTSQKKPLESRIPEKLSILLVSVISKYGHNNDNIFAIEPVPIGGVYIDTYQGR